MQNGRVLLRRDALVSLLGVLSGCRSVSPASSAPLSVVSHPPIVVRRLDALLARARLRFVVEIKPREIAQVPFLILPISRLADERRLTFFSAKTGFDLRRSPRPSLRRTTGEPTDDVLYLVRHNADQATIERLFRERLTRDVSRVVERADLVRISLE